MEKKAFVHPYIPNSVPEVREEMLKAIGVESVEELSRKYLITCGLRK